jgi:lysophospholipase L1-like esterase
MQLRGRVGVGVLAALLLGAIGVGNAVWLGREDPESAPLDPFPSSSFRIVALGDSYISGQGTRRYFLGTDEPGRNMCHRSARAYPYLLAEQLQASLVFPACSGAETADVLDREQYPDSGEETYGEVYGARPQIEILEETEDPDLVLISIGGNDAGFSKIGKDCLTAPSCDISSSFRLGRLESRVLPDLKETYARVKEAADGAPVFAMTYPSPLKRRYCPQLGGVDKEEWAFLNRFLEKLDRMVRRAARAAEIRWLPLDRALVERRFCETDDPREAAINFVRVRIGSGQRIIHLGDVSESLHPNVKGHRLMETAVLPRIEALATG